MCEGHLLRWGQGLAEIVREQGKARDRGEFQPCRELQAQQDMDAGVDLGMMAWWLRYPEQALDFRKHRGQGAAGAQRREIHVGASLAKGTAGFFPHPLRDQVIELAAIDDFTHECQGFGCDSEAARGETRRETRHAQHSQRILHECVRDMTQHATLEVGLAAVGIDQGAVLVLGDRVDGQVAAPEIVFETHPGVDLEFETGVTMAALAFASCQRVLVAAARIEKHRKVTPDTAEAARQHIVPGRTNHDPVALDDVDSE